MIINKAMDPHTPVEDCEQCVSFLYRKFAGAATVTSIEDAKSHLEWCGAIQAQLVKLIHGLSVRQCIHRDIDLQAENGCDPEFVESDYSDLIEFLSGVGVAVAEMTDRLNNAKNDIHTAAYMAGKPDANNEPK